MVIPPGADPSRLATILESLAMVRPISMSRIERVLEAERAAIPYGAALVVVSALFADPLRAACERLAVRGHSAVAVYVGDGVPPVASRDLAVVVEGERFDPPTNTDRRASHIRASRASDDGPSLERTSTEGPSE
jgi:hypothetical protein